jgi:hypothetical protein
VRKDQQEDEMNKQETDMVGRHYGITVVPSWTFFDDRNEAVTLNFYDTEQEAEAAARAWNDCAILCGRPEVLIYTYVSPDGTGYLVRVPEEWAR